MMMISPAVTNDVKMPKTCLTFQKVEGEDTYLLGRKYFATANQAKNGIPLRMFTFSRYQKLF
jgi:hypothetical protein